MPSATIKDVLTQPDADGRRAKWMAMMIEFNIELRPTKLVSGQGLAMLLAEENFRSLYIHFLCTIAKSSQRNEEEETTEIERKQSMAENLASCN